jgi:hypothetical protein
MTKEAEDGTGRRKRCKNNKATASEEPVVEEGD